MKLSGPALSFLSPTLFDCFGHAERLELRGSRWVRRAPWKLGRGGVVVWWWWWFRRKWFHLYNSHWSNYIVALAVGVRHPILFPGQLLRPLVCSSVTYLILLPHMLALFMTSLDSCSSVTYLILLPHMLALFMTSLDHFLVSDVFDTVATHAGLVYDVIRPFAHQ